MGIKSSDTSYRSASLQGLQGIPGVGSTESRQLPAGQNNLIPFIKLRAEPVVEFQSITPAVATHPWRGLNRFHGTRIP